MSLHPFARIAVLALCALANSCFSSGSHVERAAHDPFAVAPEVEAAAERAATVDAHASESPVTADDAAVAREAQAPVADAAEARALDAQTAGEPSQTREAANAHDAPHAREAANDGRPREAPEFPATQSADATNAQDGAVLTDPSKTHTPTRDPKTPLRIARGDEPAIYIPVDETLIYDVSIDIGIAAPHVGKVTMSASVQPYRASPLLLKNAGDSSGLEQGLISARAEGRYAVYDLDQLITSAYLPQTFPSSIYHSTQRGTENRENEVSLGVKDAKSISVYRRDAHCKSGLCQDQRHFVQPTWAWQQPYHCKGCKRAEHRIWKDPVTRDAPERTVDMLGAVYLARTMILEERESMRFYLMNEVDLWDVTLKRSAKSKRIEVPAGKFDAYEITLSTKVPPTEKNRDASDFEGLFGLHGSLSIWVESKTGVPIQISGSVPIGPLDLGVDVELKSYRGTPPSFGR